MLDSSRREGVIRNLERRLSSAELRFERYARPVVEPDAETAATGDWADRASFYDHSFEALNKHTLAALQQEIADMRRILTALLAGANDICCKECGEPISSERLEATDFRAECHVECISQEQRERGH